MSPLTKILTFTLFSLLFCASIAINAELIVTKTPLKCIERSDVCTREYNPVCAHRPDIVCITTPCNYITYSNPCEACKDNDVESYRIGSCANSHPTQVQIVIGEPQENIPFVSSIELEIDLNLRVVSKPPVTMCSEESRGGDVCPAVYMPVCAYKPDIVCITTPCNYITYASPCDACHDPDVESYTYGECLEEEPVINEYENENEYEYECESPFPDPLAILCSEESRGGDVCPAVYMPVCGYKPDIVCVTTPCNYITYASPCDACHDPDVESYTYGECPEEEPVLVPVPESTSEGIKCTKESRETDGCYEIYQPVCGYKPNIVCVMAPCNHITYGNACEACHDPDVESYTQGECADDAS